MICSVCGFSLDGPGHCPACGSESPTPEIDVASVDKADIEEREIEITEITTEEKSPIYEESVDYSALSPIILPFGIGDAPPNDAGLTIPYGLNFAPFIEKN